MKRTNKSICFLLPGWVTKQTGGAELQSYLLTEELIKRGWSVEVVTRNDKITQFMYLNDKIKYHYYKESKSYLLNYFIVLFTIFHTHSFFYYVRTDARILIGALTLYSYLFKRKLIYAIAGDDELLHNSYYQYQRSKNKSFIRYIKLIDAWLIDLILKFKKNKIDLIITQTEFQQKELLKNKGLASVVIRNSFNDITILRAKPAIKKNIVLWVGNMRPVKKPEIFIEIAKSFSGKKWEFVMIGESSGYELLLEYNNNYVNHIGQLSYEDTNKCFQSAKILINTSSNEGFPNTFIQAWLNKVLVISYHVNPDNLLDNNQLGFCASSDFTKCTAILNKAMNNYSEFQLMIDNAALFAENNFNLKKNTDLFEREINALSKK